MRKALRTARLIVCGALIVAGAGVALLFGYAAVAAPEANVRWGSLFMLASRWR